MRRVTAAARRWWHTDRDRWTAARRAWGWARSRARCCPPFLPGYAALFVLFSLLYLATSTRDYTFDAVAYAGQIRQFGETGEWRWLLHPHHVLFNGLGLLAHRFFRLFHPDINTLAALQVMNALLGASGVLLFAAVAGHLCRDRNAGLLAAAGLGLSYGYWTCATDGRANLAGVVVLVAALGAMARLQDARQTRTAHAYVARAGVLGALHALATLLHQSHALLLPAALLAVCRSPGQPRRRGVAAYLETLAAVAGLVYLVAASLAGAGRGPMAVLAWATTYAHQGHWWSFALWRNLGHDVNAILHAVIAQPRLTGFGMSGWVPLGAILKSATVLGLLVLGVWRWLAWRGTAAAFWVRLAAAGEEAGWGAPRRARRGLVPVLLVWIGSYAAFFTVWNPGYFVFWVPVLVPLWLLAAFHLSAVPRRHPARPGRWAGAVAALAILAVNNVVVGIAPHAVAANNGRLLKALAVGAHSDPGAVILLAGAGDGADAEVYVPYFAGREVIAVNTLLGRAPTKAHGLASLRAAINQALASGRRVFLHEELVSSEGPYRVLAARYGLTRPELLAFLRRHYRLGRPVRWLAPVEAKDASANYGARGAPDTRRTTADRNSQGRKVVQPQASRRMP